MTAPTTSREELLAKALEAVMEDDWEWLLLRLDRSGRGQFWRDVVYKLRAAVAMPDVAQAQSSDRITQAIRDYCISLGSPVQLSSDGVERIYYSGISIVGLADAILANAAPANRSTAKATANVGDNGERMGSEPAMGIVTGGSDPTRSMMPSTEPRWDDRRVDETGPEYEGRIGKLVTGTVVPSKMHGGNDG